MKVCAFVQSQYGETGSQRWRGTRQRLTCSVEGLSTQLNPLEKNPYRENIPGKSKKQETVPDHRVFNQ